MPYDFKQPSDVFERLRSLKSAYEPAAQQLGLYCARAGCYYEGIQWIHYGGRGGSPRLGRLLTNWDHDPSRPLRITANRITRLIQKVSAQTEPTSIGFDISPPERDPSPEGAIDAQVKEAVLSTALEQAGFLSRRKEANFKRTVFADYPILLSIEPVSRPSADGQPPAPDWRLCCRTFDPTQFILDPGQPSRDLRDHDEVWIWEVYTLAQFKRKFPGVQFDEARLKTVGELAKTYNEVARISDGRLYGHIRTYSKTKGVMVYQGHYKGYDGRWDQMYLVAELPTQAAEPMVLLNAENTESPFGGDGFPIAKYSGARRAQGPLSISDVWQMVDDQDRLNLMESQIHRWLQRYAGWKVFVDLSTLKEKGAKEDFQNQWSNQVGGAVFYNTQGLRGSSPPSIATMPPVPPFLADMSDRYEGQMERNVHRPEVSFGEIKCIDGDSQVQLTDGRRVAIKDIVPDDRVVSVENGRLSSGVVKWLAPSGVKPCYSVSSDRGFRIVATADHRVLTWDGWKTVGELTVNDFIVAPRVLPETEAAEPSQEELDDAVLAAVWLAEGDKTRMDGYAITNGNDELRASLKEVAERRNWGIREDRWLRIRLLKNGMPKGPNDLLKRLGIRRMTTDTIRVPEFVMRGSNRLVSHFLSNLFCCDGCAHPRGVGYCSNSRRFVDDLRSLLLRFGIRCHITGHNKASMLNVGDSVGILKFAEHVGIIGKETALALTVENARKRTRHSNNFRLPEGCKRLLDRTSAYEYKKLGIKIDPKNGKCLSEGAAEKIAVAEKNSRLAEVVGRDVEYLQVRKIALVGDRVTYDMEVENVHNFVADGVIVHNSHVPDRSYNTAIEQADQVGNVRIKEDVREDAKFLEVMLGTYIRLAKQGAPSIVGALRRAGLDEQDFLSIVRADEFNPGKVNVRESSVRNRSPEGRKNDLANAVSTQALSPIAYRMALAEDLDMPLTDMDRKMEQAASKEALNVLLGIPYSPLPLGEFSQFFIDAFRRALFDPRAKADPMARQRLVDAIQLQEATLMANQALLSGGQPVDGQQPPMPQAMTLGEALAAPTP